MKDQMYQILGKDSDLKSIGISNRNWIGANKSKGKLLLGDI